MQFVPSHLNNIFIIKTLFNYLDDKYFKNIYFIFICQSVLLPSRYVKIPKDEKGTHWDTNRFQY